MIPSEIPPQTCLHEFFNKFILEKFQRFIQSSPQVFFLSDSSRGISQWIFSVISSGSNQEVFHRFLQAFLLLFSGKLLGLKFLLGFLQDCFQEFVQGYDLIFQHIYQKAGSRGTFPASWKISAMKITSNLLHDIDQLSATALWDLYRT